jgi:hypothetical protein
MNRHVVRWWSAQPPTRCALLRLAALALVLVGCRQEDRIVVPNRVLDRPLAVALGCVKRSEDSRVEALSLNQCAGSNPTRCDAVEETQLVGFIANSERNEVAMFRQCDINGLVDLDHEAPGYNFVPVGRLPSSITATERACRVITANAGSCDLSVIDGRQLAAYAVDLQPEVAPSSLVSRIIPRTSTGEPLGARPGEVIAAPAHLSLARAEMDDMVGGGDLGDDELGGFCPNSLANSVYVTFPACQLVAEVSLTTQRILQSRRILQAPDGSIEIVDSGGDPDCPIDCPAQFLDGLPQREGFDADGFQPTTMALVEPDPPDAEGTPDRLEYAALFVGGGNSDTIVEIPFDDRVFRPSGDTNTLLLENPGGVHVIRVSPTGEVPPGTGERMQFLYVVAGDGSTHVVRRHFEEDSLGVECDTQVDPSLEATSPCHEIEPNAVDNVANRRPFAVGPGIRLQFPATINDWTFQYVPPQTATDDSEVDAEGVPEGGRPPAGAPFNEGMVGIGVTSAGSIVYSNFGQFANATAPTVAGFGAGSAEGLMAVQVDSHMLWPSPNPFSGEVTVLPRVADAEPRRTLPATEQPTQVLAPSLRKIDLAYAAAPEGIQISQQQRDIAAALGNPGNDDLLGSFDPTNLGSAALYVNRVARVAARDYRQWPPGGWALTWEGNVGMTQSATGRIECDEPGWEGGTCVPRQPGDVRLVDENATFCSEGVIAGDKLVILGCLSDDECGLGQSCLRDPGAGGGATGICISSRAYEQDAEKLRRVCAPFISDPCGIPRREYLITRAFQEELWLQSLDVPQRSYLVESNDPNVAFEEAVERLTCQLPLAPSHAGPAEGVTGCQTDGDCGDLNGGDGWVCRAGYCRGRCDGGFPDCSVCLEDVDCQGITSDDPDADPYLCIEGRCRTPCEGGSNDCRLAALPGPQCFSELARYVVRARNSYVVEGLPPAPAFMSDQVIADPGTGECLVDPTVSSLLTSRIWLGEDEEETFNHPVWGIADCPNNSVALPGDPNPCRVVGLRDEGGGPLFHRHRYDGNPVSAIRFSNPYMSIVLDLVSLTGVASPPPDFPNSSWPEAFARFHRARIPRGAREEFATQSGYAGINALGIVQNVPLTFPVRIINGPEPGIAFVVDAGGQPGVAGTRGQVVRIFAAQAHAQDNVADQNFRVR